MNEDDVLRFAGDVLPSAWALELLLLLWRERATAWTCEALVRELRATLMLVMQNLAVLVDAGLVAETGDGRYRHGPKTPDLAALVDDLAALYTKKPVAVLKAIFTPGDEAGR
jgi:hypothetical protein